MMTTQLCQTTRARLARDGMQRINPTASAADMAAAARADIILYSTCYSDSGVLKRALDELRGEYDIPVCDAIPGYAIDPFASTIALLGLSELGS